MLKFNILCMAVIAGSAWGQSPTITHVVTTGLLDTSFGPGTEVYIYGTFPSPAAGRDFTIDVGGQSGGIGDRIAGLVDDIDQTAAMEHIVDERAGAGGHIGERLAGAPDQVGGTGAPWMMAMAFGKRG